MEDLQRTRASAHSRSSIVVPGLLFFPLPAPLFFSDPSAAHSFWPRPSGPFSCKQENMSSPQFAESTLAEYDLDTWTQQTLTRL